MKGESFRRDTRTLTAWNILFRQFSLSINHEVFGVHRKKPGAAAGLSSLTGELRSTGAENTQ